jgi:hypothetical protein
MIKVRSRGDYSKVTRYLERVKDAARFSVLDKYGSQGVAALSAATPVESGETAGSWGYEITRNSGSAKITFVNTNVNQGVPIAIILQYGHGTGTGGWVEGRDYINPAIQPIFDKIVEDAWREVTKV